MGKIKENGEDFALIAIFVSGLLGIERYDQRQDLKDYIETHLPRFQEFADSL